jgi:hypothetical protein
MADEIDFFDANLQQSAPQRTILHFVRTLTAKYQKLTPQTHEEEESLGILLLAGGVQIIDAIEPDMTELSPGTSRSCHVRLTYSGINWQAVLASHESKDAVKARGAVLRFAFDAYCRNRDAQKLASPLTTPEEGHAEEATRAVDEGPALAETAEGNDAPAQNAESNSATDTDPAVTPGRFIHKPWPGSDSWHNWGIGVDDEGIWHLFHFWRSGDAQAIYHWKHHRYARVKIAAGQMDAIARRFIEQQSLPISDDDEIERIKPIISRLRKVLSDAVLAEGHKPKGSPIQSPTTDRSAYLAVIKFGKAVNKNRHIRLDCTY